MTKYINNIKVSILALEKFGNIICFNERLTASLGKLNGAIKEFIDLTECPDEIERANNLS